MKQIILATIIFSLTHIAPTRAQEIRSINSEDYLKLAASEDTLYIINHWATWCLPCVKELPYFEKITTTYKDNPVKVLLVSFDFKKQYPEQLTAWVKKKQLKSEVLWFSDQKPNNYIPIIAPDWEGNLPVTYLINKKNNIHEFVAGEIEYDDLDNWVKEQLKNK